MNSNEFRSRLHDALKQEYVNREQFKSGGWSDERREWMGAIYADMAVGNLMHDLAVPAVRNLILEYYNEC